MELPESLRTAVDTLLHDASARDLEKAATSLSERYRAERRDGRLHLSDEQMAQAYLATRLPATFAAVRASLEQVALALPDFEPKTCLDAGSGPGTALYAAEDCWPDLASATLLETSQHIRKVGSVLAAAASQAQVTWLDADLGRTFPQTPKADLVTLCYVLNELSPEQGRKLVAELWDHCEGVLVIVEPGTPDGYRRLLRNRDDLLQLGATLVAPCPHASTCPLTEPDWCHFSQRVARTRQHRDAKSATLPYEDEKFSYLAVSRFAAPQPFSRVLARANHGSGKSTLKLCQPAGTVEETMFTKREGSIYKQARKLDWGDRMETSQGE